MTIRSWGYLGILALTVAALPALAGPPKPKVSASQAAAAAVRKLGGKAMSTKYEFEDGYWQYAVIVQNKSGMFEAEVNSTTGKVTATEKTSAAEEAKEAADDAKKAAAAKSAPKKKATHP